MIDRLGTSGAELEEAELRSEMERHRRMMIAWLKGHPRAEVLVVDYPELLTDPASVVDKIRDFVGEDRLPNWQNMSAAIDKDLYRNRKSEIESK
jgi:hypothetical protein